MEEFSYILSEWILDSDGTPHLTLSSYKTWECALQEYEIIKLKIQTDSQRMQHQIVNILSLNDHENYSNNIEDYVFYVINEKYPDEIAYYQDSGWKRPMGVALKTVKNNESNDTIWKTSVSSYPIQHRGQW